MLLLPVCGLEPELVRILPCLFSPGAHLGSWSAPLTQRSLWKLLAVCGSTGEEDPGQGSQFLTGLAVLEHTGELEVKAWPEGGWM